MPKCGGDAPNSPNNNASVVCKVGKSVGEEGALGLFASPNFFMFLLENSDDITAQWRCKVVPDSYHEPSDVGQRPAASREFCINCRAQLVPAEICAARKERLGEIGLPIQILSMPYPAPECFVMRTIAHYVVSFHVIPLVSVCCPCISIPVAPNGMPFWWLLNGQKKRSRSRSRKRALTQVGDRGGSETPALEP